MERNPDVDTYRWYDTEDVLNNRNDPIGRPVVVPRSSGRVVQGFSCAEGSLRILTGAANRPSYLERWSFGTAEREVRERVDQLAAAVPGAPKGKLEVEGCDGDTWGCKYGEGNARRFYVFRSTNL